VNWMIIKVDGGWQIVDLATGQHILAEPVEDEMSAVGRLREMVNEALEQLAAVDFQPDNPGARFEARFTEGEQSVDRRVIDPQSTNFNRQPPIPLLIMTSAEHGGMMLEGAAVCGVVDELTREGNDVILRGAFDAGSEVGLEAQRMVGEGVMTRWSPDMADMTVEWICTEEDPETGFCIEEVMHAVDCTIIGGTIVPKPALNSATITIIEAAPVAAPAAQGATAQPAGQAAAQPAPQPTDLDAARTRRSHLAATALVAAIPVDPPAEWFEEPGQDLLPVPDRSIHITDSGRIYGYAGLWGTCHIGITGRCQDVPESRSGYAYFRRGSVKPSDCDCDLISTGVITMAPDASPEGHVNDLKAPYTVAVQHYDNPNWAMADVACGENDNGVWFSGALRPGVTPEQIRTLRGSAVSGDWRPIGGTSELIAMLAVNVGAFPVTKRLEAPGQAAAIVAAGGAPPRTPELALIASFERRLRFVESVARALEPDARRALVAAVGPQE
jgi:hypothetical protein